MLTKGNDSRLPGFLAACVAILVIMATCMLYYMPRDLAMIGVTWAMLSVSFGIWFGHGVLNEP